VIDAENDRGPDRHFHVGAIRNHQTGYMLIAVPNLGQANRIGPIIFSAKAARGQLALRQSTRLSWNEMRPPNEAA
jgi:hypothetical protein